MKYFDEINLHKYINLTHISEPEDNKLQMIIEEVKPAGPIQNIEIGEVKIEGVQEIKPTSDCVEYLILFESYVGYSVLNESFVSPKDEDEYEGSLFCLCGKSNFLDYLKKASFADSDYPGDFKHYRFNCSNHIIDVASVNEPIINKIIKNK